MRKFGEVLNSLTGKAGISKDDETLKKLLAFVEVSQFELPDEFASALEQKLLTSESAVANPDVRSKIIADALDGVDSRISNMLNDFEFDDTFKGDIKGTKNTYEKLNKVAGGLKEQLKAAKEKANKSGNPQDKQEVEALKKEIQGYNDQIANLKRAHEIEKQNLVDANLNEKKTYTLKSTLAAKPLPKNGLSQDINILTAQTLITQEMAKHGLNVTFDEAGNPVLKQRKDGTDMDYFVENKKVGYSDFIDSVLANNKFVQVNDQQSQQQNNGSGDTYRQQNNNSPRNESVVAESAAKLAELGLTI